MRSKLFVPASRPELFSKALVSDADALSFDLEDAVHESRKEEARRLLAEFLHSPAAVACRKTIIVRVNPAASRHFAADLDAVLQARVDLINLPKPQSPEEIRDALAAIEKIEHARGLKPRARLLINIESPLALRIAFQLAGAHARVAGLQLGLGDLFEPLAIARGDVAAVHAAMFATRMAAGEAGIFAFDAAFADIADMQGFRAEARRARDLGFLGKSCIHPSQIAMANEVFCPTAAEIAHAQKVVAAVAAAELTGLGAYVVEGKMVDGPFLTRAAAVLAEARRLGLIA